MANAIVARPLSTESGWDWSDPDAAGSNPERLATLQPGEVWGDATDHPAALVDTLSAQSVSLVALIAHNGVTGGTWRVRGGSTSSVADYDSGSVSLFPSGFAALDGFDRHISFMRFSPAKSHRYWRIDVDNDGTAFEAGRLYLANPTEPGRNYRYGAAFGVIDPTGVQVALGGQLWPGAEAGRRRVLDFALPWGSASEMAAGLALQKARGRSRDVLVILNSDATENGQAGLLYGLQSDLGAIANTHFGIFESRFRVEELLP